MATSCQQPAREASLKCRAPSAHDLHDFCAGDVKEFGFREITNQKKDPNADDVALQPVPVPPPEHMADPRLAVTVCVCGMVSAAEVSSIAAGA